MLGIKSSFVEKLEAKNEQPKPSPFVSEPETTAKSQSPVTSMALFPTALDIHSAEPRNCSVAVLGSCIAEAFAVSGSKSARIDHYLMNSTVHDQVPIVSWEQYDAVLVHLTLRQILWGLVPNGNDLFHVRSGLRYETVLAEAVERLEKWIGKTVEAVGGKAPVFFLAFSEPPSTYQGILINNRAKSFYHFVRSLNDAMAEAAGSHPSAYYTEVNDVLRYLGDRLISDAYTGHLTHAGLGGSGLGGPECRKFYSAIMARVFNGLRILRSENPVKLIITDLDNTLWNGVVAEVDEIVPAQHTEGWPLGYVEALLEFKRRGGLLAICSKNELAPTLTSFEKIWTNRLSIDDFCSVKINWEPKSKNISEILQETNLLTSNTLFIDDNPREINEVSRVFTNMRFLTGKQSDWRSVILFSPQTQVATISVESTKRTEMIQAKIERDNQSKELTREDYLRDLEIEVDFTIIHTPLQARFERALELLNKTNQFNTTGKRWTVSEIQAFFDVGGVIVALHSRDRLGENGLVALALVVKDEIKQVVMSCRVFGFGLETALLCEILTNHGAATEVDGVTGHFVDTGKNKASASYFKDHGFIPMPEKSGLWRLVQPPASPQWIRTRNTP